MYTCVYVYMIVCAYTSVCVRVSNKISFELFSYINAITRTSYYIMQLLHTT